MRSSGLTDELEAEGAGDGGGQAGSTLGRAVGSVLGNALGSAVGKPLGRAVGKPAGMGRPLGRTVGKEVGNAGASTGSADGKPRGAAPRSPAAGAPGGRAEGTARPPAARVGASAGTSCGVGESASTAGARAMPPSTGLDSAVAAGGTDALDEHLPVPTASATTPAPSTSGMATHATVAFRDRDRLRPGAGLSATDADAYGDDARAVAIGGARMVSTWGSTSTEPPAELAGSRPGDDGLVAGDSSTVLPAGVRPAGRPAEDRFVPRAPWSARRISAAVAKRSSGRGAIARCTSPAISRGASGAA